MKKMNMNKIEVISLIFDCFLSDFLKRWLSLYLLNHHFHRRFLRFSLIFQRPVWLISAWGNIGIHFVCLKGVFNIQHDSIFKILALKGSIIATFLWNGFQSGPFYFSMSECVSRWPYCSILNATHDQFKFIVIKELKPGTYHPITVKEY